MIRIVPLAKHINLRRLKFEGRRNANPKRSLTNHRGIRYQSKYN